MKSKAKSVDAKCRWIGTSLKSFAGNLATHSGTAHHLSNACAGDCQTASPSIRTGDVMSDKLTDWKPISSAPTDNRTFGCAGPLLDGSGAYKTRCSRGRDGVLQVHMPDAGYPTHWVSLFYMTAEEWLALPPPPAAGGE